VTAKGLRLVAAAAVAITVTGCGGDSPSPEDNVKAVVAEFVEAAIDGRNGKACAVTTDPGLCLRSLDLLGEGGYEAALRDWQERLGDWQERLDAATVTFADDNRATIPRLNDDGEVTELVREDGGWLIVIDPE
jgi:hypothetical protein